MRSACGSASFFIASARAGGGQGTCCLVDAERRALHALYDLGHAGLEVVQRFAHVPAELAPRLVHGLADLLRGVFEIAGNASIYQHWMMVAGWILLAIGAVLYAAGLFVRPQADAQ